MTMKEGNWKYLLNEVRKLANSPLDDDEKIEAKLPWYAHVCVTESMKVADSRVHGVAEHLTSCRRCSEKLDQLLELVRTAEMIDSVDSEDMEYPAFLILPEPDVQKPKKVMGKLLLEIKDSLGKVVGKIERAVELPSISSQELQFMFRSAMAPERTKTDSQTEFLQTLEDFVNNIWHQKEEDASADKVNSHSEVYDLFVGKVRQVPQVSYVYVLPEGQLIHIWTIVDNFDPDICDPIYDIEMEIMYGFPTLEFDFNILGQLGEIDSVVPTGAIQIFKR